MTLRWFFSATVRHTSDLCGHVRKLRDAQCDVLSPQALQALDAALRQTKTALNGGADNETLSKSAADLEMAANKWLIPFPNSEWRENIEVFLVAIVIAMAIRTFFLQPFKIPTSSMQPTLFGVTVDPLYDADYQMPGVLSRIYRLAVQGAIYHEAIAPQDGAVVGVGPIESFLHFFHKQTVFVRYQDGSQAPITVWFAPNPGDDVNHSFEQRIGLTEHPRFKKGEPIIRFAETTGDHLFVDRLTYNFRRPSRGEIIVFQTKGIMGLDQSQFYIKRLVGLPGETISIGEDRHAIVNGVRLDYRTPHFANVYSFDPKKGAADHHLLRDQFYSGHILLPERPESHLRKESDTMLVEDKHYVVFGDNTATSYDSRYWGGVPRENIIGRSFFIYWPISSLDPAPSRFGWGQR